MTLNAYARVQNAVENPRDIEYRLFAQITHALSTAAAMPISDPFPRQKALATALLRNQELWRVLRADLKDPNNQLPLKLRADLISLSLFVDRETHSVMTGKTGVEDLIGINRNIMGGLKPAKQAAA